MMQETLQRRPHRSPRAAAAGRIFVTDIQALGRSPGKLFLFLMLASGAFALYIAVPTFFIPGNDLRFYISITPWWGFALIFLLAVEVGFALTFRILTGLCKHGNCNKGVLGNCALLTGSVLPSVLTCPILAVSVLSFLLPMTSVWTLVGYRWLIVVFFLLIILGITALRYWKLAFAYESF